MTGNCTLSLAEISMDVGQELVLVGKYDRVVFVVEGSLTTKDNQQIRRNEVHTGLYVKSGSVLIAETTNTKLWVWTLSIGEPFKVDSSRVLMTKELSMIEGVDDSEVVLRLDRVDFPPGAVAHTHVHPGPGIRIVLTGKIGISQGDDEIIWMKAGEPWFEFGPKPVFAPTTDQEPTAFIRCLILPKAWLGQNTIRYVDPADSEKPKLQKYYRFCDIIINLPGPLAE